MKPRSPGFWSTIPGGFDQRNFLFTPGVHGWQFPFDAYSGNYFSTPSQGTSYNIRSAQGRSDKRYVEFILTAKAGTALVSTALFGVCQASVPPGTSLATAGQSISYASASGNVNANGGTVATHPVWGVGDIVMIAIDGSNGKFWTGLNGIFNGLPASGTGMDTTFGAGTYFAAAGVDESGPSTASVQGFFLTGSTFYSPPAGFSCWDD